MDYVGTAAVDWHTGTEIHEYAKSKGIDTNRYFPLALSFYREIGLHFSIYAADTRTTGATFDEIEQYAADHDGKIPVVQFNFSSDMEELSKYMKRLSVVLVKRTKSFSAFEEIDSISLD
jgi:hypothetical protein